MEFGLFLNFMKERKLSRLSSYDNVMDIYTMRCLFHEEKTPSFRMNLSENGYYCFSCGAKGNVSDLSATIKAKFSDISGTSKYEVTKNRPRYNISLPGEEAPPMIKHLFGNILERAPREQPLYPGEYIFDYNGSLLGIYQGNNNVHLTVKEWKHNDA